MTLYEITEQLQALQQMAEDEDVDPEVLQDTWDTVQMDFSDKAEAYCKVMKNLQAQAEALKAEADRMASKAKTISGNVDRLKRQLQGAMELSSVGKIKGKLFTIALQQNPPAVVQDWPTAELPERFLIAQDPKVDKKALMAELKAGGDPKELGAHLEAGVSLRIR